MSIMEKVIEFDPNNEHRREIDNALELLKKVK